MLYTRKGDSGTTKTFDSKPGQRISKSSCQTEALGALDELNSFIGLVKVRSENTTYQVATSADSKKSVKEIIEWVQGCLFIIQAEVAGAQKTIGEDKVQKTEFMVDGIEKEMPPITTFFISGGTELAALMDVARTLARKAERRVIAGVEAGEAKVGALTLAFLNRLSSLFYALARLNNHKSGIKESAPTYK
ncbi:MAG: cob(I)yrinic acid a,c-diamide adenosyltransferase [Candidatus Pacebacteria bacterium]|nr:cob(I)yrinic acid a,c-diamide adenosyltransferase [Candidatus Paceibacterota bacterium]